MLVSRSTLWRWKKQGVTPKRRLYKSFYFLLFEKAADKLRSLLTVNPCSTALDIVKHLRSVHGIHTSRRSVYNILRMLRFSRKRTRVRGQSKKRDDWNKLHFDFLKRYHDVSHSTDTIVSLDECGFSERDKPMYGYSPVGSPITLNTTGGGWTHYSLLMAVFSDGRKAHIVKRGSIKRYDVQTFLEKLQSMTPCQQRSTTLVLDNASIHKGLNNESLSFCFTPPYSPQYNAIELCFARVKASFRRANATAVATPNIPELVEECVHALSAAEIKNCFRHVKGIVASSIS